MNDELLLGSEQLICLYNQTRVGITLEALHTRFLTILPQIELHARIYFRHVKCPNKKSDCIAEVVAIAWKWFRRLAEKGKDATQFVSALATLASRAVNSGRRL